LLNILFVHGGMTGGWCWKKVRELLDKKQAVLTPTLTGLGERKHLSSRSVDLDTHINDIVNTIQFEGCNNVILVGHSYGGMVITGVADRIPQKIKQLVYLDALVPDNHESLFDCVDPLIAEYLYQRAQESGGGWEVPPAPPESYLFDTKDLEWFYPRCTPHPLKCFQQPLVLKKDSSIEKVYIKCTQDSALDSMLTRAKKMGLRCLLLDSGHFPMVTHPKELVELLV
jgi:pimeloyl-ACP methyl ester carboxylesterase